MSISLTFGDVAENHKGMQQIGTLADEGFNLDDLMHIKTQFECMTFPGVCEIIELHAEHNILPKAYILIIKGGVNALLNMPGGADALMAEQAGLEKDTKAFMYGRVVNKIARHNLCFSDIAQEPDYARGQGRVYAFANDVPLLNQIRIKLGQVVGPKAHALQAEGNYYYDPKKCGIGYHGDAERKKVIAIRLGVSIPLCYSWYYNNKPVGSIITISHLEHGDMYIMSEKATGYDWKMSSRYTLRHAAGCKKYTNVILT